MSSPFASRGTRGIRGSGGRCAAASIAAELNEDGPFASSARLMV